MTVAAPKRVKRGYNSAWAFCQQEGDMAEKNKKNEQQGILCMFSGGLDSVGALYLLLTDPRYARFKIHVHHMVLKNIENRALAEKVACGKIVDFLREKDFRAFEYTESLHDYSFMRRYFIYDSSMVGFMGASMLLNDQSLVMMANGRTRNDLDPDPKAYKRMNLGQEIYHAILPPEIRYQRPFLHPVAHLTHEQIYRMLPGELRDLAWSCRTPKYDGDDIRECGRCSACKRMKQIRQGG
jgi:hypothetical protein